MSVFCLYLTYVYDRGVFYHSVLEYRIVARRFLGTGQEEADTQHQGQLLPGRYSPAWQALDGHVVQRPRGSQAAYAPRDPRTHLQQEGRDFPEIV